MQTLPLRLLSKKLKERACTTVAVRYQEVADANFTLVASGSWLSVTPKNTTVRRAAAMQALAAAEHAGLHIMFDTFASYDGASDYPAALVDGDPFADGALFDADSPALWGWSLADEPSKPSYLSQLGRAKDNIDRLRPRRISFVNLLPNYGVSEPWTDDNCSAVEAYDKYLDFFIEQFRPNVLCFDHYPWMEVSSALSFTNTGGRARWSPLATMNGYRQNLLSVRLKALEHGLPFWN